MGVAIINGELVSSAEAKVSLFDRGFLYGDGVFEVLRTYGGVPFAIDEHLARLRRSVSALQIPMTPAFDAWPTQVRDAVRAVGSGEVYVRIMVTRGIGPLGLVPDRNIPPTSIILAEPLREPTPSLYEEGITAHMVRMPRPLETTRAREAKVLSYVTNILALIEARDHGAGEAIFASSDGFIREGASSNVFVVLDGVLVTPGAGSILPGITRAHVLAVSRALGISAEERDLSLDDLRRAEEMFVTSSIRELVPISRLSDAGGAIVSFSVPGRLTRRIHAAFRAHARGA